MAGQMCWRISSAHSPTVGPAQAVGWAPWHFLEALPDPIDVTLLQLVLHPLPVDIFPLPDLHSQLPLNSSQILLVTHPKDPLLLLEGGLHLRRDPGFAIWEAPYSPGGYGVLNTEVDIVCDAVSETVNVLPMGVTEYLPHRLKTVPQSLLGSLRPSSNCAGHSWLLLFKGGQICHGEREVLMNMPPWCWHTGEPVSYCLWCGMWHTGWRWAEWRTEGHDWSPQREGGGYWGVVSTACLSPSGWRHRPLQR